MKLLCHNTHNQYKQPYLRTLTLQTLSNMKKILCTCTLLLSTLLVAAAPVSSDMAKRVAETFWHKNTPQAHAEAILLQGTPFSQLYIFTFGNSLSDSGKGFVIVSADDCAYPILGYSVDSPVSATDIPSSVVFWLNQYEQEIEYLSANPDQVPAADALRIRHLWDDLVNGTYAVPKQLTSVSPMLTTTWNQSPYYNNLCPSGTPAGCSAIATAQVMKYWNHPLTGTGSHSYTCEYGTLSADFGNTVYDWDHMPDRLSSSSSSTQVNAVATLCYHVGISMNMSYATDGSGANILGNTNSAQRALVDFFGYKNTLRGLYKSSYTDAQWIEILEDELDAGRPIVYAGFDPSAGHAFVFDGYNSSNQFHVNWGWGGAYDGYFSVGALNPMGGGTGSNTTNTFNLSNQALVGIEPLPVLRANPASVTLSSSADTAAILVTSNDADPSQWHAVSDADWLSVTPSVGNGLGELTHVSLSATQNSTGTDRFATVTFAQDTDTVVVRVAQLTCDESDMCTLTVNMTDHAGDGWEDAYLTFSSTSGALFGTATVGGGSYAVETISVCPDTVVVMWHSGRHDNECGFFVESPSGNVWIDNPYGTFIANTQTFIIPQPCDTMGGMPPITYTLSGNVSDTAAGIVTGGGSGIHFGTTRSLSALANEGHRFVKWSDGNLNNPRSVVVIANKTYTPVYADLGGDTVHYDNGVYLTSLGAGSNICWGIKIHEADLLGRKEITGVKFYNSYAGNYTLTVYKGNETQPGTSIYSGTFTLGNNYTNMWITLDFDHPEALTQNKPLWVVLSTNNVSYPAVMSPWCGNEDGSMISTNGGSSWKKLTQLNRYGTWMLRAIMPFDSTHYVVSATPEVDSMGTVSGSGRYLYGARVSAKATANEGFHFVRWSDNSTYNPHTLIVKDDIDIQAIFAPDAPQGIDEATADDVILCVEGLRLCVKGAESRSVKVMDAVGRCIYSSDNFAGTLLTLPAAGVYMVSVDNQPVRRVVAVE